jgi:hypothetical protein
MAKRLINTALQKGSKDNISALVVALGDASLGGKRGLPAASPAGSPSGGGVGGGAGAPAPLPPAPALLPNLPEARVRISESRVFSAPPPRTVYHATLLPMPGAAAGVAASGEACVARLTEDGPLLSDSLAALGALYSAPHDNDRAHRLALPLGHAQMRRAPRVATLLHQLCEGNNVALVLAAPPPPLAGARLRWARDGAAGLAHLHALGVAHGAVALRHLVLEEKDAASPGARAKWVDFSAARLAPAGGGGGGMDSAAARAGYVGADLAHAPPEALLSPSAPGYAPRTPAADVYAFGVALWSLFTRGLPFGEDNVVRSAGRGVVRPESAAAHRARLLSGGEGARPPLESRLAAEGRAMRAGAWTHPELVALIKACWASEPARRPPMDVVLEKLEEMDAADFSQGAEVHPPLSMAPTAPAPAPVPTSAPASAAPAPAAPLSPPPARALAPLAAAALLAHPSLGALAAAEGAVRRVGVPAPPLPGASGGGGGGAGAELRDRGPRYEVSSLCALPEGVGAACSDGVVRVWDVARSSLLAKLPAAHGGGVASPRDGHVGPVAAVAALPARAGGAAGPDLVSAGADGTLRLWTVANRRCVDVLSNTAGGVGYTALAALGPGRLAAGGSDGRVSVWNVSRRAEEALIRAHRGAVTALARVGDAGVLSGGADGEVVWWEVGGSGGGGGQRARFPGAAGRGAVRALALFEGGDLVGAACGDGALRVWRLVDGALVGVVEGAGGGPLAATPEGGLLAVANGAVVEWAPGAWKRAAAAPPPQLPPLAAPAVGATTNLAAPARQPPPAAAAASSSGRYY